jgi:hypothetical protein
LICRPRRKRGFAPCAARSGAGESPEQAGIHSRRSDIPGEETGKKFNSPHARERKEPRRKSKKLNPSSLLLQDGA